jgi:hypothetical protein
MRLVPSAFSFSRFRRVLAMKKLRSDFIIYQNGD